MILRRIIILPLFRSGCRDIAASQVVCAIDRLYRARDSLLYYLYACVRVAASKHRAGHEVNNVNANYNGDCVVQHK